MYMHVSHCTLTTCTCTCLTVPRLHVHARVSLYPDYMYMHVSHCTLTTCTYTCLTVPRLHVHARVSLYPGIGRVDWEPDDDQAICSGANRHLLDLLKPKPLLHLEVGSIQQETSLYRHTHTHMYMSCYMNTNLVCPHTVYKSRPTAAE